MQQLSEGQRAEIYRHVTLAFYSRITDGIRRDILLTKKHVHDRQGKWNWEVPIYLSAIQPHHVTYWKLGTFADEDQADAFIASIELLVDKLTTIVNKAADEVDRKVRAVFNESH